MAWHVGGIKASEDGETAHIYLSMSELGAVNMSLMARFLSSGDLLRS